MNKKEFTRRQFIVGCGASCAAAAGFTATYFRTRTPTDADRRFRVVFVHAPPDRPFWPHVDYDFSPRKKEITQKLLSEFPDVDFVFSTSLDETYSGHIVRDDLLLPKEKRPLGYIVFFIGMSFFNYPLELFKSNIPFLLIADLYGGTWDFLRNYSFARRSKLNAIGISSSRFETTIEIIRSFTRLGISSVQEVMAECEAKRRSSIISRQKQTVVEDAITSANMNEVKEKLGRAKILVVGKRLGKQSQAVKQVFGTEVVPIGFGELRQACLETDRAQIEARAAEWMNNAQVVVEPGKDDILKAADLYYGMRNLMRMHEADAIAINCLNGFYGGRLHAYPCLGFGQLNSEDKVGACEADVRSAITMLIMRYLVNRAGYISDPVIDTSKNQIIYAHCVAPTRVFGPVGAANPYRIRSHSEDHKGASYQSILPLGYMTTTLLVDPLRRKVLMLQGKTVANVDEEKACRTKLAVEIQGDMDRLFDDWDIWDWHRVTFYGDLKTQVQEVAQAFGLGVIEEA